MKNFLLLALLASSSLFAGNIQDDPNFKYDVFFTNPVCAKQFYKKKVVSNSGEILKHKPENVYCAYGDSKASGKRESSPQYNVIKLIKDESVKEIFLTYLSFSSSAVSKALCKEMKNRDLDVTFIIDSNNNAPDRVEKGATAKLNLLKSAECRSETTPEPKLVFRGNVGGLGYAHNKLIITNPSAKGKHTLVFSSGNMSSGVVLHHENWHFLTVSSESFFFQKHLCLMNGMLNASKSKKQYASFIKKCVSEIEAEEEDDIKTYFVPGANEGKVAMNAISSEIKESLEVNIAAHRFSNGRLMSILNSALKSKTKVTLIADDDLYWSGKKGETVGSNMSMEASKVNKLRKVGLKVKYMETNENARLLHHNKFLIFNKGGNDDGVFAGAGNLTTAAFTKNFENFYMIKVPHIVEAFKKQYKYMWSDLATGYGDLPKKYVHP